VRVLLLNWQLTLISLAVSPLLWWAVRVIGNKMRVVSRKIRRNVAEVSINLHETVTGIEVVKTYAQEEYELGNFKKNTKKLKRNNLKLALLTNFFGPLNEVIVYFAGMIVIAVGVYFIIGGSLKLKQLTEFLMLIGLMAGPLMKIPSFITSFKAVTASIDRVLKFLDRKPKITQIENSIEKKIDGRIEFRNVRFSYVPAQEVLKDLSFSAGKGEVVALVGPSGAGKSTIAHMIPRFYDCDSGGVYIDGINLKDYSLKSLRSQIGIVSQNVVLFNTNIYENIIYSKRDATEDEVISVTKKAYAYDFIMQFPEKFETEIGEKGVKLSGGQKQRLAIARTFLMNPQILILDEATSSLDSESEQFVRMATEELMKGRTSIIIAHRLSTITHATKILVINEGNFVDLGTHEELLKRCDLYKKIYELQYFR
jgi:subfamily B ATP-binding cassette protein MsbA